MKLLTIQVAVNNYHHFFEECRGIIVLYYWFISLNFFLLGIKFVVLQCYRLLHMYLYPSFILDHP